MNNAIQQLVMDIMLDSDLKARAMADPAAVLAERGIEVPDSLELKIVEDTASVRHIVLPYPCESDTAEELEQRTSKFAVWL